MPRTTAKEVILEILRVADGEWSGKVKLHKAQVTSRFTFYYANEHPGFLTDWPIAKLQHGPGIQEDDTLIRGMVDEGLLEVERVHEGPYPEYRYRLTEKEVNEFRDSRYAHLAIEKATLFPGDRWFPRSLPTSVRVPGNEAQMGEVLNIYIDTIPDDEYQRRQRQMKELSKKLAGIFGGAAGCGTRLGHCAMRPRRPPNSNESLFKISSSGGSRTFCRGQNRTIGRLKRYAQFRKLRCVTEGKFNNFQAGFLAVMTFLNEQSEPPGDQAYHDLKCDR